ncbi:MAG: ribosome silencing factor [Denitrovibrio sp.]|nr:MAG: ribosome silencing factor [Denitrovibrio sp.]
MKDRTMLDLIVKELLERKTEDIASFYVAPVSSMADFIVIGTATSEPHVNAIAEHLLENMKAKEIRPFAVEGKGRSRWVCLDFGEVMVHLMCKSERDYYNLEAIWGGCEKITIQE